MTPIGNILGAAAFAVWLLAQAFMVITGPQNIVGWWATGAILSLAPLVGWSAARLLDRKAVGPKTRA